MEAKYGGRPNIAGNSLVQIVNSQASKLNFIVDSTTTTLESYYRYISIETQESEAAGAHYPYNPKVVNKPTVVNNLAY